MIENRQNVQPLLSDSFFYGIKMLVMNISIFVLERQQGKQMLKMLGRDTLFGHDVHWDMAMATRLKIAREAHGWSQSELARRAGVNQTTISAIESKRNTVSRADILFRLADTLGVSARWLATGEGPMMRDAISDSTRELEQIVESLPTDKIQALLTIARTLR